MRNSVSPETEYETWNPLRYFHAAMMLIYGCSALYAPVALYGYISFFPWLIINTALSYAFLYQFLGYLKSINVLKFTVMGELKMTKGWQCPICNKVYSPEIKSCEDCSINETEKGQPQLLTENDK